MRSGRVARLKALLSLFLYEGVLMDIPDVSGYKRAVRVYWAALAVLVTVSTVWTIYESHTLKSIQLARWLAPLLFLAGISYFVRQALLERLTTKANEAEALGRLHLATAEAL